MHDSDVILAGGRRLAFIDIGDAGWPAVVFFHGAPSSRLRLTYLEQEFRAVGVRVLAPERPGYGRSTPHPGRVLADWATDVVALADTLDLQQFVVAGHSSGGPYALLCAAQLGARVRAAIVLGGVTDMGWPGAWQDYPAVECEIMRAPDEAAARTLSEVRFGVDGRSFLAASGFHLSEPDARLYGDERIARQLARAREEAFRQGVVGYAQDIFVQGRPWSFDAARIAVPVVVVHGEEDALLPLSHSRHTADVVAGAALEMWPAHGHFTILNELPALSASFA